MAQPTAAATTAAAAATTTTTIAAMTTTIREYEVLFFKRKNKVHKSKGVSKMDGKLVLDPSKNTVKLYDGNSSIHSSINAEIATREFSVDEELNLAQYQLEIVGIMHSRSCSKNPSVPVRKPLTVSNRKPTSLLSKNKPSTMASSSNAVITSKSIRKSANSNWLHRKPPAQPKSLASTDSSSDEENDDDDDDDPPVTIKAPTIRRLAGQKRKLLNGSRVLQSKFSSRSDINNNNNNNNKSCGTTTNMMLPPSICSTMRPHQHEGVVFLWNALTGTSPAIARVTPPDFASPPKGAILADSMGMGKTLMTIATLFAMHRRCKEHRFIIVCPSSLVQNWAKEFDKWLGRASQPKRVVVKKGGTEGLQTIRGFCPIKPNHSEVLIISYDLFRMNAELLTEAQQIGLLVVDEGHRLKNSSGSITLTALEALHAEARLLITGTPIQNNLSEFHAVVNFCMPGLLGSLNDFRRDYERPITAANRKDASPQQVAIGQAQSRALDDITKAFMLRRLAKDVLTDLLPPRMELLLFCQPSSIQCDMYRSMTRNNSSTDALSTLMNLRKLCSHPDLIKSNNKESRPVEASGKLFVLEKLLDEIRTTNDKVVLVSCFTSTLTMIEEKLIIPKKWSYKRLDGTTPQADRQPLVDAFNRTDANQSFLFLLSSKAGGMGLNLIGANRLIMMDADYNPAIDHQAMARIYRPGQTKPTTIYRLFLAGTMEEVIYQRQTHKGNLARMTVDHHHHHVHDRNNNTRALKNSSSLNTFTQEELRDCFTLKDTLTTGTMCDSKMKMKWSDDPIDVNCTDQVILNVYETYSHVLSYVYMVPTEAVLSDVVVVSATLKDDTTTTTTMTEQQQQQKPKEVEEDRRRKRSGTKVISRTSVAAAAMAMDAIDTSDSEEEDEDDHVDASSSEEEEFEFSE